MTADRAFKDFTRIVVKIGTNTLSNGGQIDAQYIGEMAAQVVKLHKEGKQILLVTSGAIGMGAGELGLKEKVTEIPMRQACASIGQPLLMHQYKKAFEPHGLSIAQVLLTTDVLSHRQAYLNLRTSIETLLSLGVVPIFNENDTVSTEEIGNAFGDNDKLSALVASKVDADLLIILSDIDALYDKDPKKSPDAKKISVVPQITEEILKGAGSAGSVFSTGGMKTKIRAVLIAEKAGCTTVLAHGREKEVLNRILNGEDLGTVFLAKSPWPARTRWILASTPRGRLTIDEGALEALRNHKSLLPKGLMQVEGEFAKGSVVLVNGRVKLVTKHSSGELLQMRGLNSDEIQTLMGKKDVIARPEDMVFLDETML